MTILIRHHRYKRPPRRQKAPATAIGGPAIVTAAKPKPTVIVRKASRVPDAMPEEYPEEYKARGDAADGLWRDIVRAVAGRD
jgi:hypothetical protein